MSIDRDDWPTLVLDLFVLLRKSGFQLGIDEFLAGRALTIESGVSLSWTGDIGGLKQALKLLWCSSRSEQEQFEPKWIKVQDAWEVRSQVRFEDDDREPLPPVINDPDPLPTKPDPVTSSPMATEQPSALDTAAQPVRAPFTPAEIDQPADLQSYWPVSRRSMSYSWRYLRRTVAEGAATLVDIDATVQQTAQQGFYLEPVMRRRGYNRAQLLLFMDQNGSMMPLHQFTREIVETALYESGLPTGQVTVCYFQNVLTEYVYHDLFLTKPVELATVLANCDRNTSVLVVSDGGAARGYRRLDRMRATTGFLRQLRQTTPLCAWLNPIPRERWQGSSAEMIANLVPMFQMNDDGLSNAIDIVRGLPLQVI